ncbi:MAG: helix-turn-helix domain-containing protein [Candidatus Binatia bacterium]
MKALQLTPLKQGQIDALHDEYRTTKDVRVRTRAQMILLAAEHEMSAPMIAKVVRETEQTVRNWFKRYEAEGLEGLKDVPRPGSPRKVTAAYVTQLVEVVRLRPRSLGLPYSLWTLARLADYMAEQTGLRVEAETVRRYLKEAEIVLSRPQHKISSPDPEYQVKKRRSRRSALASSPVRFFTMQMNSISPGYPRSAPCGVRKDSKS